MSIIKKLLAVFAAIGLVTLLTGCIKFTTDLTVNTNDTVSGTMVVGISKTLTDLGADPASMGTSDLFANDSSVTAKPYEDSDFVGTQYDFRDMPLTKFSGDGSADNSSLSIVRDGNNLVTSGTLDFSSGDSAGLDPAMMQALMSSMDVRVSITYPGKILDTNGKVDGQTITWTPVAGQPTVISATVESPLGTPVPWMLIGIIVGVVVVAAVIVLVLVLVLRKKPGAQAVAAAPAPVAAASSAAPATSTAKAVTQAKPKASASSAAKSSTASAAKKPATKTGSSTAAKKPAAKSGSASASAKKPAAKPASKPAAKKPPAKS